MKKVKRFSDVQLSRILSAHCNSQLTKFGEYWPPYYGEWVSEWDCTNIHGCVLQVAHLIGDEDKAGCMNLSLADKFDSNYNSNWSIQQFVEWLNKQGVI